MRNTIGLLGALLTALSGCGEGMGAAAEDAAQLEQSIIFGGGSGEPTSTQLKLAGLTVTPSTLATPGTATVTFKVTLDGPTGVACPATLTVQNLTAPATVYSAPVTLSGASLTRSASIAFASAGEYVARVVMPSSAACAGGLKSSPLRVLLPSGALDEAWVHPGDAVQYANEANVGEYHFTFTQVGRSVCGKAVVWIEDSSGKRWSAFDQVLTNVATPAVISVTGFLDLAVPNFDGSPNFAALNIPPPGAYQLHVRGDSYDCSGELTATFHKKRPYEVVLLGTWAPAAQLNTKNHMSSELRWGDQVSFDVKRYGDTADCTASFCGFMKGHPTLGVIDSVAQVDMATDLEIVNCTLRLADSGADWVVGLVTQKADKPTLTDCSEHGASVRTTIHGVGSWARYELLLWVKVPTP